MRDIGQKFLSRLFGNIVSARSRMPNPAEALISSVTEEEQQLLNRLDAVLQDDYGFKPFHSPCKEEGTLSAKWVQTGWGRGISCTVEKKLDDSLFLFLIGRDIRSSRPCLYFNRLYKIASADISGVVRTLEDGAQGKRRSDKQEALWQILKSDVLGKLGISSERWDNNPFSHTERAYVAT